MTVLLLKTSLLLLAGLLTSIQPISIRAMTTDKKQLFAILNNSKITEDDRLKTIKEKYKNIGDLVNAKRYREAPLHIAAKSGLSKIAQYLIDNGAKINEKDGYGNTPLSLACLKNNLDLVELFVINNVDISGAKDDLQKLCKTLTTYGQSLYIGRIIAATIWSEPKKIALLGMLFGEKPRFTFYDKYISGINAPCQGLPALHRAISHGYFDIVKFLIHRGANINAQKKQKEPVYEKVDEQDIQKILTDMQQLWDRYTAPK